MPPLTTPYSGRVVGGGVDATRPSSPVAGPSSTDSRGLTAFERGPITRSSRMALFPYFQYDFYGFVGLGACQARAFAAVVTRSAEGQA